MNGEGRFIWYELMTTDVEGAKAFYPALLGWTGSDFPMGGAAEPYHVWNAGESGVGGMMRLPADLERRGVPPHWMGYVFVRDVDATVERARALGGAVHVPGTDIPDVGRFAVIADPQGAALALLAPRGEGGPAPDPRAPGRVAWNELSSTDHEAAWSFHAGLFGWKEKETMDIEGVGPYRIFRHPEDPEGRPMGAVYDGARQRGVHPHWVYYFSVPSMAEALGRVREMGGEVVAGPMEVPGGDVVAVCHDPAGAGFALLASG